MNYLGKDVNIAKSITEYEEYMKYKELGTVEELSTRVKEEDILKFYYCESEDEYYVGKRIDTMYYARVLPQTFCLLFEMSRYLPWGEHVVSPATAWKEYIYPSEPKEIDFSEWLKGWVTKYISELN